MYAIYRHTNLISGKCYIGKSKWGIERRWRSHVDAAVKGHQSHFCHALRQYPLESWSHEVLEEVETNSEANLCEAKWISHFKSNDPTQGYNMTRGGDGGMTCTPEQLSAKMKGVPKSEKHKQKMREAAQRYWANAPETDTRRQQLAERNQTDEARQLAADAQNRRWSDPAAREHMSKSLKGKPKSEEHKRKISESLKKRKNA